MHSTNDIIARRKGIWDKHQDITTDREFRQSIAHAITRDDEQGEKFRQEIQDKPWKLIEMIFVVVNKDKETVPLFLNKVQQQFRDKLYQAIGEYDQGKRNHLKFLILKGRQQGFTTYITAEQLARAIITRNFAGYTMAHENEATSGIFQKHAKFPYDQIPEIMKPHEKFNNKREFLFDNINSAWGISTAGGKDSGRSKTLFFFHGSESAFWDNFEDIMAGLGEALADGAIEILESTANGYNHYKGLWDDAVSDENNYEPLFFEWWQTPEYRLKFENDDIESQFKDWVDNWENSDDPEFFEKLHWLKDSKGLDWQQLYWYYNKKQDKKDKLPQEYPCTAEEAFLQSGRPYFDTAKIERLLVQLPDREIFEYRRGGMIEIYEEVEPNEDYVAGCDVAEGIEGADKSSAAFYRVSDWEQVARVHGTIQPNAYGKVLAEAGEYYNWAYLAVENLNHGWAVLTTLKDQCSYPNLYYTTNIKNRDDDKTKKMGWTPTEASKYLMLDELRDAIDNEELGVVDKEFLRQLREVVYDEKGKVSINGKDLVVAHAIAWQMRKYWHNGMVVEDEIGWDTW
jgi:hypothetical protein